MIAVSKVAVRRVSGEGNTRAMASVTLADAIMIHGIRVFEGSKGLFISMPQRKHGDGYRDLVHPVTADMRTLLQAAVLEEYQRSVDESDPNAS